MIAMTAGVEASNVLPRSRSGGVRGRSRSCGSGRSTPPSSHPRRWPALGPSDSGATAQSASREGQRCHDLAMTPTSSTRQVRKVVVRLTIGSFSVAALLGIAALLAGGRFGETEARILLTTLLVGVVSIAVLCYLATAGKRFQVVGVAGGVTVLVPLATALLMIWGQGLADEPAVFKSFAVGAIVAASLAQASLLLALCERGRRLIRRLLAATLAFSGLVAAMTAVLFSPTATTSPTGTSGSWG